MAKELTYRCFLEHEDGSMNEQAKKVSERLSRTVSAYYTVYPNEYKKFTNPETTKMKMSYSKQKEELQSDVKSKTRM